MTWNKVGKSISKIIMSQQHIKFHPKHMTAWWDNQHLSFCFFTSLLTWMEVEAIHTLNKMYTRLAYPKIRLSVLQTACVHIFRSFTVSFCFVLQMHHKSIKHKSVKGQFFYHPSCKNSVRTHIFNDTDALQNYHTTTLRGLHLPELFWIKDRILRNTCVHPYCQPISIQKQSNMDG